MFLYIFKTTEFFCGHSGPRTFRSPTDLLLLSTSSAGLQKNIDKVQNFYHNWGLTINSDKTKIMVFSKGGNKICNKFKYVINNSELEYVTSYKYLGINISNTGKVS